MSRQLLILRHAEAAWGEQEELNDFGRPLTTRGKEDALQIGRWMRGHILYPKYAVSSPARRAQQTMCIVANELGLSESQIRWDGRVYMAEVPALLKVLAESPSSVHTTLLVGHNPGLQELLIFLCGRKQIKSTGGHSFPTAALAQLIVPDSWAYLEAERADLASLVRAQDLKT